MLCREGYEIISQTGCACACVIYRERRESPLFSGLLAAVNRRPLPNIKRAYCVHARLAEHSHNTRPTHIRAAFIIIYGKCYSTKKQAPVQFVRSHAHPATLPHADERGDRAIEGRGRGLRGQRSIVERALRLRPREKYGHVIIGRLEYNIIQ